MFGPDSMLFAYGPVPGVELIPYFLAMLGWIVLAVFGVFFSPIMGVIRRLRGAKPAPPPERKDQTAAPIPPATTADGQAANG